MHIDENDRRYCCAPEITPDIERELDRKLKEGLARHRKKLERQFRDNWEKFQAEKTAKRRA